jgi:hypothetical protein
MVSGEALGLQNLQHPLMQQRRPAVHEAARGNLLNPLKGSHADKLHYFHVCAALGAAPAEVLWMLVRNEEPDEDVPHLPRAPRGVSPQPPAPVATMLYSRVASRVASRVRPRDAGRARGGAMSLLSRRGRWLDLGSRKRR